MKMLPNNIAEKIQPAPPSGCWVWTGAISGNGYGNVKHCGRYRLAHRVVYELLVGRIPDGMCLDHLCRSRWCVNPKHLEPVTMRENLLRGDTVTRRNSEKTVCFRCGSKLEPRVVRNASGRRVQARFCRPCSQEATRACRLKGKVQGAAKSAAERG